MEGIDMDSVAESKVCSKCKREKSAEAFFVKDKRTGRRHARCKDCHNAATLAHYYAGGEGMRQYRRGKAQRYYETNPEKHKAASRQYREKDPEKTKAACRRYDEGRKEEKAAYREVNRERRRAYDAAWKKANKDKVNAANHRRRVRLRQASGHYTAAEWQALKAKFGFRCLMCGRREPAIRLCVDHVVSIKAGGSNTIDNIQCLCKPCNSKKHTKALDLRR